MSFSACSSSALVPIPPKYPTTNLLSAGYMEQTTLNYTSTASAASLSAFGSVSLPAGVWMLMGVIRINASAGNVSLATLNCRLNGATTQGQIVLQPATTYTVTPVCFVVESAVDGSEDLIDLNVTVTTSGAANWSIDNGVSSNLRLVRVA